MGLYMLGASPSSTTTSSALQRFTVAAKEKLAPGQHAVLVDFKYDGGGIGKGGLSPSAWMKNRWPKVVSIARCPSACRSTKRSTSARTRARRSARNTTCRSSSRETLSKVLIRLGEEKLSADDEARNQPRAGGPGGLARKAGACPLAGHNMVTRLRNKATRQQRNNDKARTQEPRAQERRERRDAGRHEGR